MSFGGNTIARALALVTVATGISFVHWGSRPLASLASPKGLPDTPSEHDGQPTGTVPGDDASVPPTPVPVDAGSSPALAFDAADLDTKITTQDSYELWRLGTAVFIDAREPAEYQAGHIPGAFLIPAEGDRVLRLADLLEATGIDGSQRVVVYCEGGTCRSSELIAYDLQAMHFTKIHIDTGGFPGWQAAGYEVETGPDQVLGDPG